MRPKPAHLDARYAAQFKDASIAAAYAARPPYDPACFAIMERLLAPGGRRVLELGSGSGDATFGLLERNLPIDAIEPSPAMHAMARNRPGAADPRIRWICASAEAAEFDGPYALALAAESMHWMQWDLVLPKIARALAEGALLVLAERRQGPASWDDRIRDLIRMHSTNQEYAPYDLVDELSSRGLFRAVGCRRTAPQPLRQSIRDFIQSLHSRNGLSRDRMALESAEAFDRGVREALSCASLDGSQEGEGDGRMVRFQTSVALTWGIPSP